ncbi:VWA domain-containing protein [Salinarchaeum sp. IM2453]|uniref:VWA domain-containing protein n=1 Tax=Salinarchaeum sp. IM2453 TaxID=2862870 RepID=UPI001C837D34|nr:VWA domain-containing protein [Salinarchaeum sp. IM2453]QZA88087.1 VWA domain-containing protein [Salinarchaeum sp. IM2453]
MVGLEDSDAYLPFPAIVGQEDLKQALLVLAVNDSLDGLLIRGEKGTAKSTAVRALSEVLPEQKVISDCPYGCDPENPELQCEDCQSRDDVPVDTRPVPLVTLPLGATRERVVGTLSVSDALSGDATFDPGLLAQANRGILYVDEVNLLDDHLVDVLLDAAASGINRVEREGMSITHPASFMLVGTMNPEEGDLRPQFKDRFAMQVSVQGAEEIDERVTVIDRALNQEAVTESHQDEVSKLREQISHARERLSDVDLPDSLRREIATLCRNAGVDGHRADIATARGSLALAALNERTRVTASDIHTAARLALPHRLQSSPFEEQPDVEDVLENDLNDNSDEQDSASNRDGNDETRNRDPKKDANGKNDNVSPDIDGDSTSAEKNGSDSDRGVSQGSLKDNDQYSDKSISEANEQSTELTDVGSLSVDFPDTDPESTSETGRLASVADAANTGAKIRTEQADNADDIDVSASIRQAAQRGDTELSKSDLQTSVKEGQETALVVFVVDASASMKPAIRTAKSVVMELLKDSYQNRDEIAFITFAGEDADIVLPPTDSVALAARHLKELPLGDKTPLPAGLNTAAKLLSDVSPAKGTIVLVTDGKANTATGDITEATESAARNLTEKAAKLLLVDTSDNTDYAGVTDQIVKFPNTTRISIEELSAEYVEKTLQ